jgi:hypothetical protein
MSRLGKREHAYELSVVIVELLAHRGYLVLCEEPVLPLGRFPVVGRHDAEGRRCSGIRDGPAMVQERSDPDKYGSRLRVTHLVAATQVFLLMKEAKRSQQEYRGGTKMAWGT